MSAVENHLAVEALIIAYCAAIDRREDAAEAAQFFTDDGVLDNTALGSLLVEGRAELVATINGMFASMARLEHYLSNFLLTEHGNDAAQAQCYVQAHGKPQGGEEFSMRGTYRFEARNDAAGWKIARLIFHPFA